MSERLPFELRKRAIAGLGEIDQIEIDLGYWNEHVRKPEEPVIPLDPGGEMAQCRERYEAILLQGVKLFRVNGCDWWAGETLERTLEAYRVETGEEPDEPCEVSEEEMLSLSFTEEGQKPMSFRAALVKALRADPPLPCFFASSEW